MSVKKCTICDKEFNAKTSGKYCNGAHSKTCENCGKKTILDFSLSTAKERNRFFSMVGCSRECTNMIKYGRENYFQGEAGKESTKQRYKELWGVENPFQAEEIKKKSKKTKLKKYGNENYVNREKAMQTNLEKYGTKKPMQSLQVQEKMKATNLKKYGHENIFGSEIGKKKVKEGMLKNWGVKHNMQSEDIRKKVEQTCMQNWGVKNPFQAKEIRNKQKQTNRQKYGHENPYAVYNQRNVEHLGEWQNLEQWAKDFKEKRGRKPKYKDAEIYFGVTQPALSHRTKNNRLDLFNKQDSYLELTVCDKLDELGIKYQRHNRQLIKPLEIDIYIPSLKLGIEINDKATHLQPHQTEPELDRFGNPKKDHAYHQNKSELARKAGITLLHVWEDEVEDFLKYWSYEEGLKRHMNDFENEIRQVVESMEFIAKSDLGFDYMFTDGRLKDLHLSIYGADEDLLYSKQNGIKYRNLAFSRHLNLDGFYSEEQMKKEFSNIKKANREKKYANTSQHNKTVLNFQWRNFFFNELQLWEDPEIREKIIKNRIYYFGNYGKGQFVINDRVILNGFKISKIFPGYSHHSPINIKSFSEYYGVKSIYDPCGGWGHRLLGAMANENIEKYIYNDISHVTFNNVVQMRDFMGFKDRVDMFCEDAAELDMRNSDHEMVFTCPPYLDIEIFSEAGAENLPYSEFMAWWRRAVRMSVGKKTRVFAFQMTSKYSGEMAKIAQEETGFELRTPIGLCNKKHIHPLNKRGQKEEMKINKKEHEEIIVLMRKELKSALNV